MTWKVAGGQCQVVGSGQWAVGSGQVGVGVGGFLTLACFLVRSFFPSPLREAVLGEWRGWCLTLYCTVLG
jgi:hypothetical protein